MISNDFNFQIIHLNSVHSTNIYALELIQKENVREGLVVWSDFQEKGKGQLQNSWHSEAYKNLTFSLVINSKWRVDAGFNLSKIIACSIAKSLDTLTAEKVEIKWPNDILINKKKVGGILIENSIQGNMISSSIVGIGLNVNQEVFPAFAREATSLKLENGTSFVPEEVLHVLLNTIKREYFNFVSQPSGVEQFFLDRLYGLGENLKFKDFSGEFTGIILGVLPNGHLLLNKNGKAKSYENKSIAFLE